jgi:hypothetical protein
MYFERRRTKPVDIDSEIVVICGGFDEAIVVDSLLSEINIQLSLKIVTASSFSLADGDGGLSAIISLVLSRSASNLRCVSVISDADGNYAKKKYDVERALHKARAKHHVGPEVISSIFLLPDNKSPGELEDEIAREMQNTNLSFQSCCNFFDSKQDKQTNKRSKRKLKLWLALYGDISHQGFGLPFLYRQYGAEDRMMKELREYLSELVSAPPLTSPV